jgi:hypothetical protein
MPACRERNQPRIATAGFRSSAQARLPAAQAQDRFHRIPLSALTIASATPRRRNGRSVDHGRRGKTIVGIDDVCPCNPLLKRP